MTSPFADEATRKFFESHKYFGLEPDQVTFFQQGTIPCVSGDGRFIMETPYKVPTSGRLRITVVKNGEPPANQAAGPLPRPQLQLKKSRIDRGFYLLFLLHLCIVAGSITVSAVPLHTTCPRKMLGALVPLHTAASITASAVLTLSPVGDPDLEDRGYFNMTVIERPQPHRPSLLERVSWQKVIAIAVAIVLGLNVWVIVKWCRK